MTDGHVSWNNLKIRVARQRELPNILRKSAELHSETAAIMNEAANLIDYLRNEIRDIREIEQGQWK